MSSRPAIILCIVAGVTLLFVNLSSTDSRHVANSQIVSTWSAESQVWGVGDSEIDALAKGDQQDRDLHLAAALVEKPADRLNRLEGLAARYQTAPVIAALVRAETGATIVLERNDHLVKETELPSWPDLKRFRSEIAAGERLDPKNAYFPLMSCVGDFAAGQPEPAHSDLHRAALCPVYNDYVRDEAVAQLHAQRDAIGWTSAITDVAVYDSVRTPHYA
jgi:hypothetical protein